MGLLGLETQAFQQVVHAVDLVGELARVVGSIANVPSKSRKRVVERLRAWTPRPNVLHKVALPMFGVGVFLMTRKQLLGLKERVERSAASGPSSLAA